jgi:hypothetical protein
MDDFTYSVRSLRVDGSYSANPDDYRQKRGAIGRVLVAYLDAHLAPALSPKGMRGRTGLSWPVPDGLIVAYNPRLADLLFWGGVRRIKVTDQRIFILEGTTGSSAPQAVRALPPEYNTQTPAPKSLPEQAWKRAIRKSRKNEKERARRDLQLDLEALLK